MRPKCFLNDDFYCHSERSEESWQGLNPAESHETRRKTSKAGHFERSKPTLYPAGSLLRMRRPAQRDLCAIPCL